MFLKGKAIDRFKFITKYFPIPNKSGLWGTTCALYRLIVVLWGTSRLSLSKAEPSGKHFHAMELNKTMEIGFSNFFYNDILKIFPGPIFPVGEPDGKICDKSTPWTTSNVQDLIAKIS